jgi:hypothetical protein
MKTAFGLWFGRKLAKAVERIVDGLWRVWGWLSIKLTICLPYRVRAYES